MNIEINHSGLNIKEESIDNENALDGTSKSNGFLYVDMNDYNENNFNGIDIKEEEEQVEDLLLEKNSNENGDIYFDEILPLNSLKNLANHSQNEMTISNIHIIDKSSNKRGAGFPGKTVQKENILVKTQICGEYKETSESKRYTLRSRKSSKINLDLCEDIPNNKKNSKVGNDGTICSKFNTMLSSESSESEKMGHKCRYCNRIFNSYNVRNAHLNICLNRLRNNESLNGRNYVGLNNQIIPEDNPKNLRETFYTCDKCNRTFKKKTNLTTHISKSDCGFKEYVCVFCDQSYVKKSILKKHIIAHIMKEIKCQWCSQTFKASPGSNSHTCVEKVKETGPCSEYSEFLQVKNEENENKDVKDKYSRCEKSSDNHHSSKVSYSTRFSCQICKKNFKSIISYRKHLNTHKGVNESDTKEDISIPNLVGSVVLSARGQGSNSSKKKLRYKCDICDKLFIKLVKLKIHILNIHQGVNYQCEKCSVKFLSMEDLEDHKAKEDCKPEDLCTCKLCGKVFAKRDYLKKHQYMHMNILFKCKYCYCAFMKEKSYKKHMEKMNCSKSARKIRMAEFNYKKCRICEVEFETEEFLIKHFRVSHVGLEPHQCFCCDSCLPTFLELQNHIHQHNIQKYTCNLCGKPYTSQEGFRKHRLKHKGAEFKCKFCESEFLNENRFKFHEKTCKKNPDSSYGTSQTKEKPKKKDGKPKQSRQLHWESRIIMKRLRGDPTLLSRDQKFTSGQQDSCATSTFFDEPESEITNERGWFDNYYKTEEDDIAFGLKKVEGFPPQELNSDLDMSEFLLKGRPNKTKTNSPPSTTLNALNSDTAEDREAEVGADSYSQSSETSSTDSDEEVESTDLPIDYNPKKCRLCIISFGQEYELLHHFIKSHPGEYAHKCPHCGVQSPLYAQLKEHMKTHGIGMGIFNCDNCSKQFKSEKKMNSHNVRCKGINNDVSVPDKKSVSQAGDEGCKRCGKKFQTKFGYRRHKQLCKKRKSKNPEKVAPVAIKLSASKEVVTDGLMEDNDFQLSEPEEEGLKGTNVDTQTQTTASLCTVEPTCTSDSPPLTTKVPREEKKEEMKGTYSGEPPLDSFPCRLCDKKFQYERGIVMHFKTAHPGNKPLICHVCNMHLADKLKEHLKTHGIGEEFICELCGKRFNQKFLSKIHEMWHQGIEYKCNNCKQKFLNKEKMDKHIGENRCSNRQSLMRLPCDICGKSYRSKFGLSKHYITHTPKELRPVKNRMNCEYCGKWFENNNGLQRHRRIHTGERPFCCRFCPKAFAQEGNCKAHERIHTGESKPRKKKLSAVVAPMAPPTQIPPSNPLVPQASTVPPFSLPTSTVDSISYPGHISLYTYTAVDPSGIVH